MSDVLAEFESAIDAAEVVDRLRREGADEARALAEAMPENVDLQAAAAEAETGASPWWPEVPGGELIYRPNLHLLVELMTGPLRAGEISQSGRLAKSFDAYMAYELRRAGFNPNEVFPRNRMPRVFSDEMSKVQGQLDRLQAWLTKQDTVRDAESREQEEAGDAAAIEARDERLAKVNDRLTKTYDKKRAAYEKRKAEWDADMASFQPGDRLKKEPKGPDPLVLAVGRVPVPHGLIPGLRDLLTAAINSIPQTGKTDILGRFYVKQVDAVVAAWNRGPDVLVSGKTMWSSFGNNAKNRYEETLGEAANLRDRYPQAALAYGFIINDDVLSESGAYARLQDLMLRTRKPYGPYDATLLLLARWDERTNTLSFSDPLTHPQTKDQKPPVDLSATRFFTDLLNTVIKNTPEGMHEGVRELKNGRPVPGGAPDLAADDYEDHE